MSRPRRDKDIHSLPKVKGLRSALRKRLTPAEAAFWKLVRGSEFEGRKFVRQHSVGNYIIDFYCPSEKLAGELDGRPHFSTAGQLYDQERRAFLESKGIFVVRFENRHVFDETEWVLDTIRSSFRFGPPVQQKSYAPHASVRDKK